jgi:hypothetical protein
MRLHSSYVAGLVAIGSLAFAQAAPRANPSVTIGGKKISVEYGQPSLGDRTVEALLSQLPKDRMWRAGSEQVTTFETEGPVMLGDEEVAAGKYSLYLHCAEDGTFSVALNEVLGQPLGSFFAGAPDNLKDEPWPHSNYQDEIGEKEIVRVPMVGGRSEKSTDRFTITLTESGEGATMLMSWGTQTWSVGLKPAG